MTLIEAYKAAEESAEQCWNRVGENSVCPEKWMIYRDMMQDLRAMGKTDEHIWHEFITGAYIYGYLAALKDKIEYENSNS